jgi:isopentenyl-diphosphate delta-isomerase
MAADDLRIPAWDGGVLRPLDKIEVHRRGLRHKAVSVFVTSGDRILLQRRALGKYHTPGLWANTCCTHPHWGELPEDCARRRLREELGIEGLALTHAAEVEYRADVGSGMVEHELVDVFLANARQALRPTPNPVEVMDVRWMSLGELEAEIAETPACFTPWLRIYLAEHRDRIFGAPTP